MIEQIWEKIKKNKTPKIIKTYSNGNELMVGLNGKSFLIKCRARDLKYGR